MSTILDELTIEPDTERHVRRMEPHMKIALAQINTRVGDFEANYDRIVSSIEQAQKKGADLVVFPELALCGYPPRDLVELAEFRLRNREYLEKLAAKVGNIGVLVGAVTEEGTEAFNRAHNSACFLRNGRIEFIQHKTLLPTYDVFDEARNFVPATRQRVMRFRNLCLGITVCEDVWNNHVFWQELKQRDPYGLDPVTTVVQRGAEIIINISASPYHLGKVEIRQQLLKDIAREHQLPVVYVNAVGGNDHVIFDGNSMVVSADGQVVARAKAFDEDIVIFDTGLNVGDYNEYQPYVPMAELYDALTLGVRDYFRKCGFSKAVIGLSGGIDSAVTAAIAVNALGKENVTGITMPSEYSSSGSIDDSAVLAANLGINMYKIPIQPMKDTVIGNMEVCNIFNGKNGMAALYASARINVDGLADENMQARLRGLILMTYSNQHNALVLSTGNKSELAVGYCTLYGDMCGGLAVISDVPKTMVYELAEHINKWHGNPIPENTITKAPSAELAPGQYDQQALPPYDVLDSILERYIEMGQSVAEIVDATGTNIETVLKVVRLIDRNEYKRQQATIGLKVTAKAFGIGRRMPIAKKGLY